MEVSGEDHMAAAQLSVKGNASPEILDTESVLVEWAFKEVGKGCLANW